MGWFFYMLITGGLAFLGWFMHSRAEDEGTAYRDRFGGTTTIWSFIFYFALLFFAIGLLPIFAR